MVFFRVIGDAHGFLRQKHPALRVCYLELAAEAEHSLQIGDLGFDYSDLANLDPRRHRVVAGNHDDYTRLTPHFLGDFGSHAVGGIELFFVRGGHSVDWRWRREGIDLFRRLEQLSVAQGDAALDAYRRAKPELMISHECPAGVLPFVVANNWNIPPSFTARLLQDCWNAHQPKLWVFGHHHRDWQRALTPEEPENTAPSPTRFVCLNELSRLDFNAAGEIVATPRFE